jgi:hypothetical protein
MAQPARQPSSLQDRAADDLRFIRETMERGATFTSVPGRGGMLMGAIGLFAAVAAWQQPTLERWLAVWLAAAGVAFAAGVLAIWKKAGRTGVNLNGRTTQSFGTAVIAPIAAGAGITYMLWSTRAYDVMPASWLLLYGAGILAGGAFSVAAVRIVGAIFMCLGFAAALTPPEFGNVWLGIGFGGVQILGGLYIARNHGG